MSITTSSQGGGWVFDGTNLTPQGIVLLNDGTAGNPSLAFINSPTTGIFRVGSNLFGVSSGGAEKFRVLTSGTESFNPSSGTNFNALNSAAWSRGYTTELLTLSTVAATTDTVGNLLPASAVIEAVAWRVNTTITTAANYSIGDPTTAARFVNASTNLTAGQTGVGTLQYDGAGAAGPTQTAASKLRVTCNVTPGAGVIRFYVFYRSITPPAS